MRSHSLLADEADDTLKEHLMEDLDFSLVPEEAWEKLVEWYGLASGSRPIARKVVEYGLYMKHLKVEVYLLNFTLVVHPRLTEYIIKQFSRADSVGKYIWVSVLHIPFLLLTLFIAVWGNQHYVKGDYIDY